MPLKTCPDCEEPHGTRKKVCDCGYVFVKGNSTLFPEPGGWLLDLPQGSKVEQPEPLPRGRKLTCSEVRDYVAYEGLGFSIYTLIPFDMIKDKRLAQHWKKARAEMQKIVEYLEKAP